MRKASSLTYMPILLAVAVLAAGCKNDGANPVVGDQRSATSAAPGTGAGNSATGATGGTATSPAMGGVQGAGATPGVSGAATATGGGATQDTASGRPADMSGTPQPGTNPTEPSR